MYENDEQKVVVRDAVTKCSEGEEDQEGEHCQEQQRYRAVYRLSECI